EHQLDVLVERVGHADWRLGHLPRLPARVTRLDLLYPPLDLADIVQVIRQTSAIVWAERAFQLRDFPGHPIEQAAVGAAVSRPLLRRRAGAEQLIERRPRIADHRQ